MRTPSLTLRLSRRAIAATALQEEGLAFCDGRHLTSRKDRAVAAAERYVQRILDLTTPARVLIDAPAKGGSTTTAILDVVTKLLSARKIAYEIVTTAELLQAYGTPALHSRTELRRLTELFWTDLPAPIGKVKPFVVEAAAVGLYADTVHALGDASP